MQKKELLLAGIAIIVVFSSFSLAYTGDITNGIISADTAYHELIYIANGTDGAGNILSIDANEDGTIDTSERSVEGVRGSGIPNALMKFRTNKNVTNSTIYELNGNVGFHIKNPTDRLQINGGHIWNLGQNDAGLLLRSGDEGSNGINIITSSNGDLRIQTRYDKKNYDSLFIKGDSRNIGIGITNPLRALDIRSDDGIHLEPSKLPNSPLAGDIAIDNKDKKLKWYDGKEWLTVSDSKSLDADDGSPSDVVYVDSIGNVGIGTTSPGTKLEVNGDAIISGDTQITGQLSTQSDIDMGGNMITNLGTPKNANDVATVSYVDNKIGAAGDNLGNHISTQNIQLKNYWLSSDGQNKGIRILNDGRVRFSQTVNCDSLDTDANGNLVCGSDAYNAAFDTEAEIDAAVANNGYITSPATSNTNMGGNRIVNLAIPLNDGDAATKKYVDDKVTSGAVYTDCYGECQQNNDPTCKAGYTKARVFSVGNGCTAESIIDPSIGGWWIVKTGTHRSIAVDCPIEKHAYPLPMCRNLGDDACRYETLVFKENSGECQGSVQCGGWGLSQPSSCVVCCK